MLSSRRTLILIAVVFLVVAVVLRRGRGPDPTGVDLATVSRTASLKSFVTASGEIVATRYADIGSSAMGRVVALTVKEGDRVRAGQVLARIDRVQAASSATAAAAALAALEAEARATADQSRSATADLAGARARATAADQALARARELRSAGLLPQAEFDAAVANADAAAAQVAGAEAGAARVTGSSEAAVRRVAQGRAEQTRARDLLEKTEITAPIDGVVTRLDVEEGEMVVIGVQNQPGSILMTVSDLSAVNAEVKVAEADVLKLAVGNAATVTLEAAQNRTYSGTVVEVGVSALPQIGTQAAAREFRVRVRLSGAIDALRPGLTCDAEILVAERRDVLTVPLQAVVQRGEDTGVFVVDQGVARFHPLTTGIIGGLTIEVNGLAAGTTIVAGPFQALRELTDGGAVVARPAAP